MLIPHPRSFLFFATECLRVQDKEESLLPSWLPPTIASQFLDPSDRWSVATLERHSERTLMQTEFARRLAEAELADLLGGADAETIPPALLARYTALLDHLLQGRAREEAITARDADERKRRDEQTAARTALRPRVVMGLVGLDVGPGSGSASTAAALARRNLPTAVVDGKAQDWHVRNALKAYVAPVRRCRDAMNDPHILALAGTAAIHIDLAQDAWARLCAEPGYKPSAHIDRVDRAVRSGSLAHWLSEAGNVCRGVARHERSAKRLRAYLLDQQIADLVRSAKQRGLDIATRKERRRNAIAPASSWSSPPEEISHDDDTRAK